MDAQTAGALLAGTAGGRKEAVASTGEGVLTLEGAEAQSLAGRTEVVGSGGMVAAEVAGQVAAVVRVVASKMVAVAAPSSVAAVVVSRS